MPQQPSVLFTTGPIGTQSSLVPAPPPAPSVLFGTPHSPVPKSAAPKVLLGGVVRRRIPCSIAALSAFDPTASADVLQQALRLVESVNLDDAHFDDVVRFGAELQAEHGAITEIELNVANHPAMQQAQTTLADILQIFGRLDPAVLFASQAPSLVKALSRWVFSCPSSEYVFGENYPQLLRRIDDLGIHAVALADAADRLATLKPRYAALFNGIVSTTLAANFILDHCARYPVASALRAHYVAQLGALETRVASIMSTRATLEIGLRTHEMLRQNLSAFRYASSEMLEQELPAFHAAYTAVLTTQGSSTNAMTALQRIYAQILHTLKGEKP